MNSGKEIVFLFIKQYIITIYDEFKNYFRA